jgi:hypothetical protein
MSHSGRFGYYCSYSAALPDTCGSLYSFAMARYTKM